VAALDSESGRSLLKENNLFDVIAVDLHDGRIKSQACGV
jgi:hypothetical protein